MFEDSTFESMGRIRTRSRGWMLATFIFNGAILAALILVPLLHPEALSDRGITTRITAPPTPVEEPKPVERPERATPVQTEIQTGVLVAPTHIPRDPYIPNAPEPPVDPNVWIAMGGSLGPAGPGGVLHGGGTNLSVVRGPTGPQHISSGVAIGLVIHKVIPNYPPIARTVHLEGTVILQATISKGGTIENLRVVTGPAMLQQAAIDAVAQWRYRPYLLNGQPVEVETTVNVEFKLQ